MFHFLRSLFHRSSPAIRLCRPEVEALEQREVPTYNYPGWHGFAATEGQTFTDLECNWRYGSPVLDSRPAGNYQVTISWGDNSPNSLGFVQFDGGYYRLYCYGHAYPHWTDAGSGYPDYPIDIWLRDLNPVPGEDPVVHFSSDVAVFPAATYVQTNTVHGVQGQVWTGRVGTVTLPNAEQISSPLQVTVVWNDNDVGTTQNGKAWATPLGGSQFAVYATHKFGSLTSPLANPAPGEPAYSGPLPYGFVLYASTRPGGMQGGWYGSASGLALVDLTAKPDPVPKSHHHPHHPHRPPVRLHPLNAGRGDMVYLGSDGRTYDEHGQPLHRVTIDPGRPEIIWKGADGSAYDQQGRLIHGPTHK
jgi:hypothetical protein